MKKKYISPATSVTELDCAGMLCDASFENVEKENDPVSYPMSDAPLNGDVL